MRKVDTKEFDIKLRIFDFDGTIYPNPDILNDHIYKKMQTAIRKLARINVSLDDVKRIGLASYKLHGHSGVGLTEAYNLLMHQFYDAYHKLLNPGIITTTKKNNQDLRTFCEYAIHR